MIYSDGFVALSSLSNFKMVLLGLESTSTVFSAAQGDTPCAISVVLRMMLTDYTCVSKMLLSHAGFATLVDPFVYLRLIATAHTSFALSAFLLPPHDHVLASPWGRRT